MACGSWCTTFDLRREENSESQRGFDPKACTYRLTTPVDLEYGRPAAGTGLGFLANETNGLDGARVAGMRCALIDADDFPAFLAREFTAHAAFVLRRQKPSAGFVGAFAQKSPPRVHAVSFVPDAVGLEIALLDAIDPVGVVPVEDIDLSHPDDEVGSLRLAGFDALREGFGGLVVLDEMLRRRQHGELPVDEDLLPVLAVVPFDPRLGKDRAQKLQIPRVIALHAFWILVETFEVRPVACDARDVVAVCTRHISTRQRSELLAAHGTGPRSSRRGRRPFPRCGDDGEHLGSM
jgi:hypothetical protein